MGPPPQSVFTHEITLVQLSDNRYFLQDGDFGREYFLGSTNDEISSSLQRLTTEGTTKVREHEKLIRNFISHESFFMNQKDFAESYPPLDSIALLRPPERLSQGKLLWRNVSVTPEILSEGFFADSAMKFLSSEGESLKIDAMIRYPLGIADRAVGWVDAQNPEETQNKVLLKLFTNLRRE